MSNNDSLKEKLLPFALSLCLILADQITKALVVAHIPLNTIGFAVWDDFFRIIHVRNTGIAFSLGGTSPAFVRTILFSVVPLIVILTIAIFRIRTQDLTQFQHWVLSGIIGGGLGNILDRIFRPEGVVDFIDLRFYGLFGFERWPTFNVADSSVVVCGILLFLSLILQKKVRS